MKTIIAGSRTVNDYTELLFAINGIPWVITEVVSGCAKGADRLGERYAKENNLPLYKFPAEWDRYGKVAGYKRNIEMAKNAEAALILWDGKSRGSMHMIKMAKEFLVWYYVYYI